MKNFLLGTLLFVCGQALRATDGDKHLGGTEY